MSAGTQSDSALSIPAPDRGIITDGDQDAAVSAEAGLPDGRCTFGEGQRGAPEDQTTTAVQDQTELKVMSQVLFPVGSHV